MGPYSISYSLYCTNGISLLLRKIVVEIPLKLRKKRITLANSFKLLEKLLKVEKNPLPGSATADLKKEKKYSSA